MTDDTDEVVREFLGESRENLDQVDLDLVALEKTPDDLGIIARIFRAVHTIKGSCGFLGFERLEAVSHAGENVLNALRDQAIVSTPALTSVLLAMVDAIREVLHQIATTGAEGDGDYSVLIERLTALYSAASSPPIAPVVILPAASEVPATVSHGDPATGDTNIRVDVALLDKLMNLVGELVLARNQIVQFTGGNGDATFVGATQQLNLITTELQEGVMKTRMQPIGNIWHKFPRVVRDLALACEKQVDLVMEGETTELDKTLIEAIKDPLTHLVRNAVDHGIETPERRLAAGKPAHGRLLLRAFHEGGQVIVEVTDDGAGLDAERIKQKAIERGIVLPDQASRMTQRELFRLVFLPGFSTAAKVTNVSGRGVGMDVVRTNIERIGGTIDLEGSPGAGTTVKIKIPLTLAIVPAVIATSGENRYAIPQASLLELVRIDGDEAARGIEFVHGAPVYRLRGKLLTLVYLSSALQETHREAPAAVNIVVLMADDRQFGLVVDAVHDTEEIVVKPLGKHLKGTQVFAGATIMGDGRVALILDIVGLAKRARVVAEGHERARQDHAPVVGSSPEAGRESVVLVRRPGDGRMAIPLSRVARLEELSRSMVERAGYELLVQYRGELMLLLELESLFVEPRAVHHIEPPATTTDTIHVVVFSHGGGHVGLIVDEILDIVDASLGAMRPPGRSGVVGSLVIMGRVTELLDVEAVLKQAHPPSLNQPNATEALEEAGHGI